MWKLGLRGCAGATVGTQGCAGARGSGQTKEQEKEQFPNRLTLWGSVLPHCLSQLHQVPASSKPPPSSEAARCTRARRPHPATRIFRTLMKMRVMGSPAPGVESHSSETRPISPGGLTGTEGRAPHGSFGSTNTEMGNRSCGAPKLPSKHLPLQPPRRGFGVISGLSPPRRGLSSVGTRRRLFQAFLPC